MISCFAWPGGYGYLPASRDSFHPVTTLLLHAIMAPPPTTKRFGRVGITGRGLVGVLLAQLAGGVGSALAAQHPEVELAEPLQPQITEGVDYRVYDRAGNRSSILAIVSAAVGEDVLLVGEEHDDVVGHAFETALFETVLEEIGGPGGSGRTVVLSLEMFERDVQYVVDEYLAGLISEDHFLRSSRPWDQYEARYRPLVESARAAGSPVVAANAPRRYVNRVSSEGPFALRGLSAQALSYLPPLPYPGPSREYRAQWDELMAKAMAEADSAALGGSGGEGDDGEMDDGDVEDDGTPDGGEQEHDGATTPDVRSPHGDTPDDGSSASAERYGMSPNVIQAQALWDAAMGHAITDALVRHVGGFVVHFAGSFHVERGTGIPERIADYRPGTRVLSVVMTKVDDVDAWSAEEHASLADFVVLTKKPPPEESAGS